MLRDECEAYGRKLNEAGVETVIARYNGTVPAPDKLSCGSELLESLLEEYRRGKHEVNRVRASRNQRSGSALVGKDA